MRLEHEHFTDIELTGSSPYLLATIPENEAMTLWQMPFHLVFLQSFPETLILVCLGLVLVGIRPPVRRIIPMALLTALFCFLIRNLLPPGLHLFFQLPFMVIMLAYACRLPMVIAMITIFLGFLGVGLAEIGFDIVISTVTGISVPQAIANPLWRILFPLPEFIFLTLVIVVFNRYHVHILEPDSLVSLPAEGKTGTSNLVRPLMVLGVSVLLVSLAIYYQIYLLGMAEIFIKYLTPYFSMTIIYIALILSLVLIREMLRGVRQRQLMEVQQQHISDLHEMTSIIKAQRHDFVNHLQVVFGFLSLGEVEEAREYIQEVYQDVRVSGDILRLAIPELSALLLVKMGLAAGRNISLTIRGESNLSNLRVPSRDLVAVVGNLINNALEAVENLPAAERAVELRIFEKAGFYIIQTHNSGCIPPEQREQVFEAGFSTKGDKSERGMGLASVKHLVEKSRGMVLLSSHPRRGTRFTICYPHTERRKRFEYPRSVSQMRELPGSGAG